MNILIAKKAGGWTGVIVRYFYALGCKQFWLSNGV